MPKRKRKDKFKIFDKQKKQRCHFKKKEFKQIVAELGIQVHLDDTLDLKTYNISFPILPQEKNKIKQFYQNINSDLKRFIHPHLWLLKYELKKSYVLFELHFKTPKDRFSKVLNALIAKSIYVCFIPKVIEEITSLKEKALYNIQNADLLESMENLKLSA